MAMPDGRAPKCMHDVLVESGWLRLGERPGLDIPIGLQCRLEPTVIYQGFARRNLALLDLTDAWLPVLPLVQYQLDSMDWVINT